MIGGYLTPDSACHDKAESCVSRVFVTLYYLVKDSHLTLASVLIQRHVQIVEWDIPSDACVRQFGAGVLAPRLVILVRGLMGGQLPE